MNKALAEMPPEGQTKSRAALDLTDEEKAEPAGDGLMKYLLVGWVPQGPEMCKAEPTVKGARDCAGVRKGC